MKDKHYLKKKKIQLILKFTNRLRKRSIGQILDFKDILIKFVVYIFVYNGGAMSDEKNVVRFQNASKVYTRKSISLFIRISFKTITFQREPKFKFVGGI